jgi:hypothetical protein
MINNTVFKEKSLLQRSDHLGIKSFPNVTLDGQIVQQFPHLHPHVRHVCYIFCQALRFLRPPQAPRALEPLIYTKTL